MKTITFEIEDSTVVQGRGTDKVSLKVVGVPSSLSAVEDALWIDFSCQRGTAIEYLKTNFGIEPGRVVKL